MKNYGQPDHLLYNSSATDSADSERYIAEMQRKLDMLKNKNATPMPRPQENPYNTMYAEMTKLTPEDQQALMQDPEYLSLERELQVIRDQALMSVALPYILNNPDAIQLLEKETEYVRKFRVERENKEKKFMKQFQDYITNHPDKTWHDFLATLKKSKK